MEDTADLSSSDAEGDDEGEILDNLFHASNYGFSKNDESHAKELMKKFEETDSSINETPKNDEEEKLK